MVHWGRDGGDEERSVGADQIRGSRRRCGGGLVTPTNTETLENPVLRVSIDCPTDTGRNCDGGGDDGSLIPLLFYRLTKTHDSCTVSVTLLSTGLTNDTLGTGYRGRTYP